VPGKGAASPRYSRMFSAFAAGAFLFVTGSIGFDVRYMHGFFEGGRWVGGPVWGQIALGAGLLLLGAYWSRRLGDSPERVGNGDDNHPHY
jgi:hypothetical protein